MIHWLEFFAVIGSGVLTGALLTEALVLVPYWKRMEIEKFLRLHHTLAPLLLTFFAPLTVAGTLFPITACVGVGLEHGFTVAWVVSGFSSAAILAFYFLYFREANRTFEETKNIDVAAATLATWSLLHNVRTAVALLGFVSAAVAYAS